MATGSNIVGARAFIRSLNLLLKSVRLYGTEHGRTASQLHTAWEDLRGLLESSPSGFLLGVSGPQLLIDGIPLEAGPAEKSFAEILSAGGLASLQFSTKVTPEDFRAFVRAFAAGSAKAGTLVEQLQTALGSLEESSIRINEVRFVAEDSATGEARVAAQLTAQALGGAAGEFRDWLNDPKKLLQLLAAAQGSQGGGGAAGSAGPGSGSGAGAGTGSGSGTGTGSGGYGGGKGSGTGFGTGFGGSGSGSGMGGTSVAGRGTGTGAGPGLGPGPGGGGAPIAEQDLLDVFRVVTQIAKGTQGEAGAASAPMQPLAELPASSQDLFRQALAGLAASAPSKRPDAPMLLQLAEHLSIRFALERFERGEVRVNAVRQLIEKLSGELTGLRKVLSAHEEKMTRAGMVVESHADLMDRQFWASVPDSGKRAVLLSPEAWCVPPRNIRQFVEKCLDEGQSEMAASMLSNYAATVGSVDKDARRKAAIGVSEMAGLYFRTAGKMLDHSLQCVSEQLGKETDPEIQQLLAATFVRLEQEAATRRYYTSVNTALDCMEKIGAARPAVAQTLRPRIAVENHLPGFLDEAISSKSTPAGLGALLRRLPRESAQQLAARFSRSERREDCNRIFEIFGELGTEGVAHLCGILHAGPVAEAASTIGLLSRVEPQTVSQVLPARLASWNRFYHDIAVRQLASGAAPQRTQLLTKIFSQLDALVLPEAVDEIGMGNDPAAASGLLQRIAAGETPQAADPYLRVKAIEALGRLRVNEAALLLRSLAESKKMFRWVHAQEIRLVATQALEKIDPEWTRDFLPRSGLSSVDLAVRPLDPSPEAPWARQRRYARVQLPRALTAVATTMKGDCKLNTSLLSMGGGMATAEGSLAAGTQATVKLQSGLRPVRASVLIRGAARQRVGFEFVEMDLEERTRLRHLLATTPSDTPFPPAA